MWTQKVVCIQCGKQKKEIDLICDTCNKTYSLLAVIYDRHKPILSIKDLYKYYLPYGFFKPSDFRNYSLKKFDKNIWIKNEGENKTKSIKEKELIIGFKVAKHLKYKKVFCVSSGSGIQVVPKLAKQFEIKTMIYSPVTNKKEFENQYLLGKDYETTFKKALKLKDDFYNITPGINPYSQEGSKIISWQIVESKLDFDFIVVPCGNGSTLWGIYKGFKEAYENELIKKFPRLFGVELRNGPIGRSLITGKIEKNKKILNSRAKGIDVKESFCLQKAIIALKESKGEVISVSEKEINDAYKELRNKGYKASFTAAASLAASFKLSKRYNKAKICCILTANE